MSRFLTLFGGIGLGFLFASIITPIYFFSTLFTLEIAIVAYVIVFLISSFLLIGLRDFMTRQSTGRFVNLSKLKAAGIALVLLFASVIVSYIVPGMLFSWLHPGEYRSVELEGLLYVFASWWFGVFLALSWWYLGLDRKVSLILGICLLIVPITIYLVPLLLFSVR